MTNTDLTAIGARIQKQRLALGLTQQDIYEKLDVSQNHYSRIENGHVGMSLDILIQISALLHISTDYILTGTVSASDACPFLETYNQLSDQQKAYIEQHIQLFAESQLK